MPNPITWLIAVIIVLIPTINKAQDLKLIEPVRFLALGDSYTIGERVQVSERWPEQFFDSLGTRGVETESLTVIARTGWTTEDLMYAILAKDPPKEFNLVSLLIGVNDQYLGYDTTWYITKFEKSLLMAIDLAQGNKKAVFVLSIPDYAYTPFGGGSSSISKKIDSFNNINRSIAESYDITYIDITPISREGLTNPKLVASDGLHPSGLMYSKWVSLILKELIPEKVTELSENYPEKVNPMVVPNPASNSVDFILHGFSNQSINIQVFSTKGQLMVSINSKDQSIVPIKTYHLEPGIYYYIIRGGNGKLITGKFMKI